MSKVLALAGVPHFHAATHRYTFDGHVQAAVSVVLAESGLKGPLGKTTPRYLQRVMAKAAEFGTEVHAWTAMYDKHAANLNHVPLQFRAHVETWDMVKSEEHAPPWLFIEGAMCAPCHAVAGTADRIGHDGTVWEIKTGIEMAWHRWQVAGYLWLYSLMLAHLNPGKNLVHNPWERERVVVYLHKDGRSYHVRRFTDPHDLAVFEAAVTLYNARRKFKLLGDGDGETEEDD